MMTPDQIRAYASNRHAAFLCAVVTGEAFFPLDVRFGRPNPTAPLAALMQGVATLLAGSKLSTGTGYTVECAPQNTRRYGEQSLPSRVYFAAEEDFVGFLGCTREVATLRQLVSDTRATCPRLMPWLAHHPSAALEHVADWAGLLKVCAWFEANPRSGLYAREVPVPLHTKFIEEHQPILRRLLDHLLVGLTNGEADSFYGRFHLRDKEALIRVRVLDRGLLATTGVPLDDFALPVSRFNALPFEGVARIVIVENELPLLTLPALPGTVGLWGRGNAVGLVASAPWLRACPSIVYWGDIDDDGLAILARLRRDLPHVRSVMMDEATMTSHRWAVVSDQQDRAAAVPQENLTDTEWRAWHRACQNSSRLEQERIPLAAAEAALRAALQLSP